MCGGAVVVAVIVVVLVVVVVVLVVVVGVAAVIEVDTNVFAHINCSKIGNHDDAAHVCSLLSHWGWDKMSDIFQTIFSNTLLEWKFSNFEYNLTEVFS